MDWLFPLAVTSTSQRQVWRFAEQLPLVLAASLVAGALAFAAFIYLLEPKVRRGWAKLFLAILRGAIIVGCAVVLFDPIESEQTEEVRDSYMAVVVDKSVSMTLTDRYEPGAFADELVRVTGHSYDQLLGEDRLSRVKAVLSNSELGLLKKLRKKNRVKLYSFDAERQSVIELEQTSDKPEDKQDPASRGDQAKLSEDSAFKLIGGLKADGTATAIGDALNKIHRDLRNEKLSGIILMTDGRQNAGSYDPLEEARRYGRRVVPIHTVGVGDPREPRDLIVDNLQAPDVTIVGDIISFDCTIKARGYKEPVDVDVELLFDGKVRERTRVQVGGKQSERAVRLRTKPSEPGEFQTEIKITVLNTEMTADNNRASHRLRVIDQRIKVLYIEGYPRWEYRYLKNALVRDRSMEVQCLLLSAEPGFLQESSNGVPRLPRLPGRKQLLDYHVIIIGDVNPEAIWPATDQRVFPDKFWDTLSEFVGDFGGGVLFISGERDMPKRLARTSAAKLLPVVVDERSFARSRYTNVFYPQLTRLGAKNSLMRLDPDESRNGLLWRGAGQGLPGFYWYERSIKAKPLARVLAVHPTEENENGKFPIFAWQYFKSGTVFWSGVDSTWRWRAGVGDTFTYRFYGQIIRFLSHGRFQRSKRFSITSDKTSYTIGEEVQLSARVYDRDLKPTTNKVQDAELEKPDGTREKIQLQLIDGKPGNYESFFRATIRGQYKASLMLGDAGSEDEVAPRQFEVKLPSAEMAEPRMDEMSLKKIAELSGGSFVRLDKIDTLPELIPSKRERIPLSAFERKLWDRWEILAALMALLVLEWIGRKMIRLQ